ncbi:MAG: hypothetical protein ACOYN0_08235 [Phycisphaerales bacterium]
MNRRGFTLIELLVLIVLAIVVASALALAQRRAVVASQLASSTANLERWSSLSGSYSADNQDRTAAFSWRGGVAPPSQFADLRVTALNGNDLVAAAAQAVDIIRRRSSQTQFAIVNNWVPQILYSHLVLSDYAGASLPDFDAISPADAAQLGLARQQMPGERVAFASSYEINPYFWQVERASAGQLYSGVVQGSLHSTFQFSASIAPGTLGPRLAADIRYPAQKAYVYDRAQRHFSPSPIYFAFAQSRVLVLAADGNVAVRNAGKCTPGFLATSPRSLAPLQYTYSPTANEPPIPPGASSLVNGYLRWTRGGLEGRDFDGADIDTIAW